MNSSCLKNLKKKDRLVLGKCVGKWPSINFNVHYFVLRYKSKACLLEPSLLSSLLFLGRDSLHYIFEPISEWDFRADKGGFRALHILLVRSLKLPGFRLVFIPKFKLPLSYVVHKKYLDFVLIVG